MARPGDRVRSQELIDGILRAAMASLPYVNLLLVDTEMRYLAVTGAMAAAYGYDPGSMIGRRVVDVLPPSAFALIGPKFERALRGDCFTEVIRSPEYPAILETTYRPAVANDTVLGALVVVRDITVEHRALSELAASEHQHQILVDNINDVVTTTGVDGRFTWVSPSATRALGWRSVDLLGRSVFDYVHPKDVPHVRRRRAQLIEGGDPALVTYRFRRSDGTWLWFESHLRAVRDPVDDTITGVLVTARDITERHELESHLAQALEMFERSFAAAPIGMALIGPDGQFIEVNSALCTLLGRGEEELLDRTFQSVTHPDDLDADVGLLRQTAAGVRDGYRLEKRYLRPDGTHTWALLAVSVVRDDDGAPRFFIAQVEDITERKNALRQLEHLATTDPLTRLPNRALLMDRLRHALALARRGGWLVGVIFIDLNRFKQVNDALGHDAGDELLRIAAERLSGAAREGDTTSRLGGDEFVVVCEHVASVDEVTAIAERLHAELTRPIIVYGHDIELAASVGVTAGNAVSAESLLREADRSMYAAKHSHSHHIDVYTEALEVVARDQLALHSQLREGIDHGELRVHYQPIVDLRAGTVIAHEALVRWAHPTLGLLTPGSFLPGTDRSRLGILIGEHVLRRACADAAGAGAGTAVHVNVSARHLADVAFPGFVAECLDASGLAPSRLVLEITESLVLDASPSTLTATTTLTGLGVGLSLDDFGTGYSSLAALNRLPIASFKIDRSFVADATHNPTSAALVEGLISLGAHMNLDVVAEGVETRQQADWLTARGCPYGQGFHLGRPAARRGR